MFTVGNFDRYINHYIGRHSINIAVNSQSPVDQLLIDSRSTINRLSTDWRSRGGRLLINSRPTVDRQSDKPSAEYQSIFHQCTSTKYRSHVGAISVNCRWYVSQLTVAYPAFSKRFVGAGHSEEGGSQGGEGTLPSACKACTFRGVCGHSPSEIFLKFGCSKVPFGAVWGDLKRQNCISFAQLYLPSFSIKWPNVPIYWHIIQVLL